MHNEQETVAGAWSGPPGLSRGVDTCAFCVEKLPCCPVSPKPLEAMVTNVAFPPCARGRGMRVAGEWARGLPAGERPEAAGRSGSGHERRPAIQSADDLLGVKPCSRYIACSIVDKETPTW